LKIVYQDKANKARLIEGVIMRKKGSK